MTLMMGVFFPREALAARLASQARYERAAEMLATRARPSNIIASAAGLAKSEPRKITVFLAGMALNQFHIIGK